MIVMCHECNMSQKHMTRGRFYGVERNRQRDTSGAAQPMVPPGLGDSGYRYGVQSLSDTSMWGLCVE